MPVYLVRVFSLSAVQKEKTTSGPKRRYSEAVIWLRRFDLGGEGVSAGPRRAIYTPQVYNHGFHVVGVQLQGCNLQSRVLHTGTGSENVYMMKYFEPGSPRWEKWLLTEGGTSCV